jgi:tungstate transport system ATP-binding protein
LSAPGLSIQRIVKGYGERRVLDFGPAHFEPGVLHVIEGDNGAGKTTLLKCASGLEVADAIDMDFRGQRFAGGAFPSALRAAVVYVHQHPYLFSGSLAANIEYGLKCRNIEPQARAMRVRAAMAWAGLDHVANVAPRRLSGGEKQRLALARAAALEPAVLLADEPTANLDRAAREQVHVLLDSLVQRGTLVIVATHDPALLGKQGAQRWFLSECALLKQ